MTAFDLAEVRGFTADLDARMTRCDNGEGMECANLDGTLRLYATLCWEFCEQVRQWGRAVFAGQVAFDPEVERLWRNEAIRYYAKASELLVYGERAETGPCYVLEGRAALGYAAWYLQRLLAGWVTPKLAVAPLARQRVPLDPAAVQEVRKRVDALPPLPADWRPADPNQWARFQKLRKQQLC